MVKKAILVFMVVILSLAIFAPKRELYYMLEDRLMQSGIIIDDEQIEDGLISLTINHPKIYVRGILIANVDKIRLWTIFFYSRLAVGNIDIDKSLQKFVPSPIKKVQVAYSLANPTNLSILVTGDFENINGQLSLKDRVVHIDITDKKLINRFKSQLRLDENGWYYETSL